MAAQNKQRGGLPIKHDVRTQGKIKSDRKIGRDISKFQDEIKYVQVRMVQWIQ